jgi:hypothetical protein
MSKIPVGATIAHAYRFTFGGFLNLVRLTWLPQVLIVGLMFTLLWPAMTTLMQAASGQAEAPGGMQILTVLLASLFILVLAFAVIAAIARAALGMADSGSWLNFPLGRPAWRLIGAFLLFLLICIGVAIVLILASFVLGFGIGALAAAAGTAVIASLVKLVVMVLIYAVFAFVGIRLGFLLTPVVIAEEKIGMRRSWALSKGNFWRLLVIALGTLLPFFIAELLLLTFVLPPVPHLQPGEAPQQFQAAILAWEADYFTMIQSHWLILAPVLAVLTILVYGLLVGAQCFAYRAVTDGMPEA